MVIRECVWNFKNIAAITLITKRFDRLATIIPGEIKTTSPVCGLYGEVTNRQSTPADTETMKWNQ